MNVDVLELLLLIIGSTRFRILPQIYMPFFCLPR